jgi:hypothetical protein
MTDFCETVCPNFECPFIYKSRKITPEERTAMIQEYDDYDKDLIDRCFDAIQLHWLGKTHNMGINGCVGINLANLMGICDVHGEITERVFSR